MLFVTVSPSDSDETTAARTVRRTHGTPYGGGAAAGMSSNGRGPDDGPRKKKGGRSAREIANREAGQQQEG